MHERLNYIAKSLKYKVFNRHLLKQIRIASNSLLLKKDDIREFQWCKLREIVAYAFKNCPYYREKYTNYGLSVEDIQDLSDFQRIPIISREEIRANLDRIVPVGVSRDRLYEVHTGGTTGVPLKIYRDKGSDALMDALFLRTIGFWGFHLGSKTVWIWGLPKEQERLYDYRYQPNLRRFLSNQTWFNAFDITEANMLRFSAFLNKFRPSLIISHVSMLCEYAHFLDDNRIRASAPKAIWVTAEPSDPSQRHFIETIFKAKTFNQYGSSEILHIAAECSEKMGLHIHADARYVEVVDSHDELLPTGEIGNIVVTDLENRVMPLIRYKIGDLGSLKGGRCRCGLSLPLMNNIVGRKLDMIRLRNGKTIYGHIFASILFRYSRQIRQFQVHQVLPDKIIVRIIPHRGRKVEAIKGEVMREFHKYTENMVSYSFEIVRQIEREKSGKLRYVKSTFA